jgi:hypothetical protein
MPDSGGLLRRSSASRKWTYEREPVFSLSHIFIGYLYFLNVLTKMCSVYRSSASGHPKKKKTCLCQIEIPHPGSLTFCTRTYTCDVKEYHSYLELVIDPGPFKLRDYCSTVKGSHHGRKQRHIERGFSEVPSPRLCKCEKQKSVL